MAKLTILALLTLCALASAAFAQKSKSEFNFLNPTPTNQMRETNTDRPDKTEGPYTVDAGHVQIEMDLANYSYFTTFANASLESRPSSSTRCNPHPYSRNRPVFRSAY